eukprot:3298080-Pleurochrysis_carterae.AAC.1
MYRRLTRCGAARQSVNAARDHSTRRSHGQEASPLLNAAAAAAAAAATAALLLDVGDACARQHARRYSWGSARLCAPDLSGSCASPAHAAQDSYCFAANISFICSLEHTSRGADRLRGVLLCCEDCDAFEGDNMPHPAFRKQRCIYKQCQWATTQAPWAMALRNAQAAWRFSQSPGARTGLSCLSF